MVLVVSGWPVGLVTWWARRSSGPEGLVSLLGVLTVKSPTLKESDMPR